LEDIPENHQTIKKKILQSKDSENCQQEARPLGAHKLDQQAKTSSCQNN